jgi:hypothetical protein
LRKRQVALCRDEVFTALFIQKTPARGPWLNADPPFIRGKRFTVQDIREGIGVMRI